MLSATFSLQLPSWAGLRPQQCPAKSLHFPIPDPNPRRSWFLQIRMGGGPRTFPGGVTKWQWKKMQQKKATQILKARLLRERQLYEMRKRAELKAAMAATNELEKPWEKTAPILFSVTADEQLLIMADRFVKPGAIDLWTEKDGPQNILHSPDGKPSVRVFPKDALYSTKPYARVFHSSTDSGDARSARSESSSEQATEYPLPHPERNASSNYVRRDFHRISRSNTGGSRSQDRKLRGNFQYSEKSERYKLGKGNGGSNSRPGSGVQGFRSQDRKFRGDFQYSEKSEGYKSGKRNGGSIPSPASGVKGPGVRIKKGGGRIRRLYPADNSSGKSNGYLQVDGVQSFAGFDLAKGSRQKSRIGQSSSQDDYDYDKLDEGSEQKSFL